MDTEYVYPQDKPDGEAGLARAGGLTLRDYFAAQALVGAMANDGLLCVIDSEFPDNSTRDAVAIYAYAVADSMLKARAK